MKKEKNISNSFHPVSGLVVLMLKEYCIYG